MKFRLWTILWAFALLASAMATFGVLGIVFWVIVTWLWTVAFTRPRKVLLEWIVVIIINGFLAGLLFPSVSRSYESERVAECRNKLSRIAAALLEYKDKKGALPSINTMAEDVTGMHSWRSQLLPLLGHQALFDQLNMSAPWNDGSNRRTVTEDLSCFRCRNDNPTQNKVGPNGSYFAVVGPNTAWEAMSTTSGEFADDPGETLLLVEVLDKGVPWSEPVDLTFDEAVKFLTSPAGPQNYLHDRPGTKGFFDRPIPAWTAENYVGINVALADGSTRYLSLPVSKDLATALLTPNGGEVLSEHDLKVLWDREFDYSKIYAFAVFVILTLLPAARLIKKRRAESSPEQPD